MKKYLTEQVVPKIIHQDNRRRVVLSVGFATFFFGFFAGAVFNFYLLAINSPFVKQFRSTLTYKSAILGDGILLPVVNMIIALYLLRNTHFVKKHLLYVALISGACITAYFHITQALGGIVNWAMPTPWHWNGLGLWHALYMYCVTSFLSLFYLVLLQDIRHERSVPKEAAMVTGGIILFLFLLRFDYIAVSLRSLLP